MKNSESERGHQNEEERDFFIFLNSFSEIFPFFNNFNSSVKALSKDFISRNLKFPLPSHSIRNFFFRRNPTVSILLTNLSRLWES